MKSDYTSTIIKVRMHQEEFNDSKKNIFNNIDSYFKKGADRDIILATINSLYGRLDDNERGKLLDDAINESDPANRNNRIKVITNLGAPITDKNISDTLKQNLPGTAEILRLKQKIQKWENNSQVHEHHMALSRLESSGDIDSAEGEKLRQQTQKYSRTDKVINSIKNNFFDRNSPFNFPQQKWYEGGAMKAFMESELEHEPSVTVSCPPILGPV